LSHDYLDTFKGVRKAYIKDLTVGATRLVKVGDIIGECKLIEILLKEQSVRLKPTEGLEFTIVRKKSTK